MNQNVNTSKQLVISPKNKIRNQCPEMQPKNISALSQLRVAYCPQILTQQSDVSKVKIENFCL